MASGKSARRWLSDNTAAALISAAAVILSVYLSTCQSTKAQDSAQDAALKQQRESFKQQRDLSDRDELRNVLDESVEALETLHKVALDGEQTWVRTGRRLPRTQELDEAFDGTNRVGGRLDIRLRHTAAEAEFTQTEDSLAAIVALMVRSPPTKKNREELDELAQEGYEFHFNSFLAACQNILAPPK